MRTRNIVLRLLCAGGLIMAAIAGAVTPATAAQPAARPCESTAAHRALAPLHGNARTDFVNKFVTDLRDGGATQDQIDAALSAQLCFGKPKMDPVVRPMDTTQSDAHAYVNIYTENLGGQVTWYAIANYDWTDGNYWNDIPFFSSGNPIQLGGMDGFGISFGTSVIIDGWSSVYHGNNHYNYSQYADSTTPNSYGVADRKQDRVWDNGGGSHDLNILHGSMTVDFHSDGGCKYTQAFTSYTHDWNSQGINSIGAGVDSFSISWASSGHEWSSPGITGGFTFC